MRNLANDLTPLYEPGGFPTCHATGAVTGKRLCTLDGDRTGGPGLSDDLENLYRVKQCDAAGQWALGVLKTDGDAAKPVGVYAKPGAVVPITSGAAIASGLEVMSDATGRVVPFDGAAGHVAIGRCMTGVGGADLDAEIKLY
jgi:hypothetical protein